jgi:hypothetical protein
MKYLKRFNDNLVNESLSYPNIKYKEMSSNDLDALSHDELNRILICNNDGQDTNCYTYVDIRNIISSSVNMKPSEIIDEFCQDFDANMTNYIYFDIKENQYKEIKWK